MELLDSARTGLDVVLLFVRNPAALLDRLPGVARSLALRGRLWVCWLTECPPLDEGLVRHVALDLGMVDDKRASLGGGWLGLRLKWETRPRAERPGDRRPPSPARSHLSHPRLLLDAFPPDADSAAPGAPGGDIPPGPLELGLGHAPLQASARGLRQDPSSASVRVERDFLTGRVPGCRNQAPSSPGATALA